MSQGDRLTAPIFKGVYDGEEPLSWKGGLSRSAYEKLTGSQSTLLPISFLEIGLRKARAVARIRTSEGLGTGFLISDTDIFLTNHHVLPTAELAESSKVQFNYQRTVSGLPAQAVEVGVASGFFYTSKEDDWSVVKLTGNPSASFGFIELKPRKVSKNDFVNIVQHPGGEHKQIALYHNLVTFSDDSIVQYLTDTLPGSSGACVFNSDWDAVALHHSGGWITEPGLSSPVLRNEGINITRVIMSLSDLRILS
jgi:V8-like Glu-specific endopeptidase